MVKERDPSKRVVMTVKETADALGIGLNQAYEAIQRGDIPHLRLNKRILVPRAALQKKLESAA
jgi:excisionase family DNA binding protein